MADELKTKYVVELRKSGRCTVRPKSLRYEVDVAKTAVVVVNAESELEAANAAKSIPGNVMDAVFGMAGNGAAMAMCRCLDETFAPVSPDEMRADLDSVDFDDLELGVEWGDRVEVTGATRLTAPLGGRS